jgi:hypothetical protein
MAVPHGRSTWSLDHMIVDPGLRRAHIAAAILGVALTGCSNRHVAMAAADPNDGPFLPTLSQGEVLDLAAAAALREGLALAAYGQPEIRYELLDGKWVWLVFYPGIEEKPDNFFTVLIDTRTRVAEVLTGE